MSRSTFIKLGLAVLALGLIAVLVWNNSAKKDTAPTQVYTSIDNKTLTSQDLKGKVVLVNFWATSCVTCVKEMPMLVDTLHKYHEQGYETVAIAMSYDNPDYVRNFVSSRGLPFHVVFDKDGSHANAFGDVQLTPTSFLIDKQGNIIKKYLGEPKIAEFHQDIEQALAKS